MPRVKKEAKPIKKTVTTTSLRAPKGRGNLIKKIASSPSTHSINTQGRTEWNRSTTIAQGPRNDRKQNTSLSVPVYSLTGRASGTLTLPKEIFGQKVNKTLLAQAVRVYMANQKIHTASTKTRGEVEGSTAKIYKQKGTGRARHGAIRAPIFVGGGIVFGPKFRKVRLDLPKKMKKAALISALSSKAFDKNVFGLTGVDKTSGKTKEIAKLTKNLKLKTTLIVTDRVIDNMVRAARNIPGVNILPVNQLNAYQILRHQSLVISKEAVGKLANPQKEAK